MPLKLIMLTLAVIIAVGFWYKVPSGGWGGTVVASLSSNTTSIQNINILNGMQAAVNTVGAILGGVIPSTGDIFRSDPVGILIGILLTLFIGGLIVTIIFSFFGKGG